MKDTKKSKSKKEVDSKKINQKKLSPEAKRKLEIIEKAFMKALKDSQEDQY